MSGILSTFVFIFLAALPGRTTFILMLLAASHKAKNVIVGAAAAFLVQASISILLGQLLALIPGAYVDFIAAILFLHFARKFWMESKTPEAGIQSSKGQSIPSVFALIFMAELGDISQLAIATTASKAQSKLSVFFVAVGVLWLITVLAVLVGRNLRRLIPFELLQRFASFVFLAIALYFLVEFGRLAFALA